MQATVGDSDDACFGDFIEDKTAENPSEMTSYSLLKDKLSDVLATLTERESFDGAHSFWGERGLPFLAKHLAV